MSAEAFSETHREANVGSQTVNFICCIWRHHVVRDHAYPGTAADMVEAVSISYDYFT